MTAPFRYFLVPNRVPLALAPRYYLTHFLTVNLEVHGLQGGGLTRRGQVDDRPVSLLFGTKPCATGTGSSVLSDTFFNR